MTSKPHQLPGWHKLEILLNELLVETLSGNAEIALATALRNDHHYLGAPHPVGERIWYSVMDHSGD